MKRWFSLFLILALLLTGCTAKKAAQTGADTANGKNTNGPKVIGVCIPRESAYWNRNGQLLKETLESRGYQVELRNAENSVQTQIRQVGELISTVADCLIIAPVDSAYLIEVEEEAAKVGIPVIAYDRLLMDTDAISAHVTFDYEAIGKAIGQYIVTEKKLDTAQAEARSYTIEFFMGSADDNNALLLHTGLMEVLNPYLLSDVLVCRTGRTSFEDTYTLRWDTETAKTECSAYLTDFYTPEEPLQICCAASDELALGCIAALEAAGYTQENWPLITGHGAILESVQKIAAGRQAMTVYKDTRALVAACADNVQKLVAGEKPVTNNQAALDNNSTLVPAYVCESTVVDKSNYKDVLLAPGIYTEAELQ